MSVTSTRPLLSRRSLITAAPGLALAAAWGNRAKAQAEGNADLPDAARLWHRTPPAAPPPLSFTTPAGARLTLADYAGHVLVVNLWATSCLFCIAELPGLAALAARIKPFGGLVLPISIDSDGAAAVQPFFAAQGIHDLPMLLDPTGHNLDLLETDAIPVSIVLDPAGRQVARLDSAADWNTPDVIARLRAWANPGRAAAKPARM